MAETSVSTRGRIRSRSKAAWFSRTVISSPAPPATYSYAMCGIRALASGSKSSRVSGSVLTTLTRISCRRARSFVVLLVHPAAKHPSAERTEPAEDVIHVAEIGDLDQVTVEILHEEQPVPARRLFGRADDLDPVDLRQILVPAADAAHVDADVRQAAAVPFDDVRRQLRLEVEDLDDRAAWNAYPADLAGTAARHAEEAGDAVGRRIRHANQRTAEHVPVEPYGAVE